ncbi:MAG: M56 family metallopeptidase, partial [Planctomycetaceae bacterium]
PADRAGDLEFPTLPQPVEFDIGTAAENSPAERLTWQAWLMLAWLLVAVALAGRIAWQRLRLAQFLRQSAHPQATDGSLVGLVEHVSRELGLKRTPRVVTTPLECSPFVCGMWRPVLVLPRGLAESLDETQFRHVLLHELAHVRRRDLIWGWLPEIARIVWWFHPVVYWMTSRLRLERELACDQVAMWHTDRNAAAYADTLYRVVSRQSEPTALKAAAGTAGLGGKEHVS